PAELVICRLTYDAQIVLPQGQITLGEQQQTRSSKDRIDCSGICARVWAEARRSNKQVCDGVGVGKRIYPLGDDSRTEVVIDIRAVQCQKDSRNRDIDSPLGARPGRIQCGSASDHICFSRVFAVVLSSIGVGCPYSYVGYSLTGEVRARDRGPGVIHRARSVDRNVLLSCVDVESLERLTRWWIEICAAEYREHRAGFNQFRNARLIGCWCADEQVRRAAGIDVADRDGASKPGPRLSEYFYVGGTVGACEIDDLRSGGNRIQIGSTKHEVSRSTVSAEAPGIRTTIGGRTRKNIRRGSSSSDRAGC